MDVTNEFDHRDALWLRHALKFRVGFWRKIGYPNSVEEGQAWLSEYFDITHADINLVMEWVHNNRSGASVVTVDAVIDLAGSEGLGLVRLYGGDDPA